MNKNFKCVVFDLDGTLIDSGPDLLDSLNFVSLTWFSPNTLAMCFWEWARFFCQPDAQCQRNRAQNSLAQPFVSLLANEVAETEITTDLVGLLFNDVVCCNTSQMQSTQVKNTLPNIALNTDHYCQRCHYLMQAACSFFWLLITTPRPNIIDYAK